MTRRDLLPEAAEIEAERKREQAGGGRAGAGPGIDPEPASRVRPPPADGQCGSAASRGGSCEAGDSGGAAARYPPPTRKNEICWSSDSAWPDISSAVDDSSSAADAVRWVT